MDNSALKRIKLVVGALYVCLIVYLIKFIVIDNYEVVINAYNPRLSKLENRIIRGKILDSKDNILAYTDIDKNDDLRLARVYPFDNLFSHIVGYSNKTKTGIEFLANTYLLHDSYNFFSTFLDKLSNNKKNGYNVITTLDLDIQKKVNQLLGNNKGSVIVLEANTGKILSLVSKPDFNPNEININWEEISNDKKNNPLLNRATQGLYPPGSIFKIIPALAFSKTKNYDKYIYNCKGYDIFDNDRINCYNKHAHGRVNLNTAFAKSCNSFFATIGINLGGNILQDTCNQLYFNRDIKLSMPIKKSEFNLNGNSSINEIAETSIGQGKTLVTPMHMGILISSIANGGLAYKPYVIDKIANDKGKTIKKYTPEILDKFMETKDSTLLQMLMRKVITEGTGKNINSSKYKVYGKTGTAENETPIPHAWFVGYADYGNKKITVVVLLENNGTSSLKAVPLAGHIFDYYYNNLIN